MRSFFVGFIDDDKPESFLFLLQFSLEEGSVDGPIFLNAQVILADEHAYHITEFFLVSRFFFRQGIQHLQGGLGIGLKVLLKTEGVGCLDVGARAFGDGAN